MAYEWGSAGKWGNLCFSRPDFSQKHSKNRWHARTGQTQINAYLNRAKESGTMGCSCKFWSAIKEKKLWSKKATTTVRKTNLSKLKKLSESQDRAPVVQARQGIWKKVV